MAFARTRFTRVRSVTRCCLLCLAALGLAGCGDSDPVVAEVAGARITATELRAFVEQLPDGLKSPHEGDAARQHYLQSLVDRRLMLLEARARGLDTTGAVTGAVDNATRSMLTTRYQRAVVMPRVQGNEEDLQRHVTWLGYDKDRQLHAILVHTREEIDRVVAGLEAGTSFEELARAHSLDERSSVQGGELGFVGIEAAQRLHVPSEVFRNLPVGQVSDPLPAGTSWHVVRFDEDRPADLSRVRNQLEQDLFARGLQQAEEAALEQLRARFDVVVDDQALTRIVDAYGLRNTTGLDTSSLALYTFDDVRVSVSDAQQVLRRGAPAEVMAHREGALALLSHRVLMPRLYAHAAVADGLIDGVDLEQYRLELVENMLLEGLRRQETESVDVSPIEARQFYDDHPEYFIHERSVWAEELLLASEAEARQVRRLVEEGADFAELVSQSLRAGAEKRSARHHYHPREVGLYPRLVPALLAARQGELMGPLEVDGGWSVFRIAYTDEGGIESFESVQRRARALLLRRRQQDAFGVFLRHLRDVHSAVVVTHAEHLANALPDEVL